MAAQRTIIIGAGHGGASVAGLLRQFGYEGKVILLGDETVLPYQRPPLSKAWLKGEADTESAALRSSDYYTDNGIDLRGGARAVAIDRDARAVIMDHGERIAYDHLILATGSRPIVPPVDGTALAGVHCLRSASDAEGLKAELMAGRHIVVVGGGYIGLEVAASAIALGARATVVEREARLLARSASPLLADFFAAFHRKNGVAIRLGSLVTAFEGVDGRISSVRLSDGESISCDLVLLGVGAVPNLELARSAGLACDQGITVDADARTSDPSIFAIGDVTTRPIEPYGELVRLESVANALEQAKLVAAAICGRPRPKAEVTWNWSDQFDLKFQVAGLSVGVDRTVVRGDLESGTFAIFHLTAANELQQVEAVNAPAEFMLGKKLIASRKPVDPDVLASTDVALQDLLA